MNPAFSPRTEDRQEIFKALSYDLTVSRAESALCNSIYNKTIFAGAFNLQNKAVFVNAWDMPATLIVIGQLGSTACGTCIGSAGSHKANDHSSVCGSSFMPYVSLNVILSKYITDETPVYWRLCLEGFETSPCLDVYNIYTKQISSLEMLVRRHIIKSKNDVMSTTEVCKMTVLFLSANFGVR